MKSITRRALISHAAVVGTVAVAAPPLLAATPKIAKRNGAVGALPERGEFVIRGAVRPVNVAEPLMWLGERMAVEEREQP